MEIKKLQKLFNEIIAYAVDDGCQIYFPRIVDKPKGIKQECEAEGFDHEYIDQETGNCCDDYFGTVYYPIEDKYIAVGFRM